jgi:hypothetical protein
MGAIGQSQDLWGPEGEQFNQYTNQRWPLGTALNFQDGRKFRFCENGATLAVAGNLYQSPVPDAAFDTLVLAANGAIGDRTVSITTGAAAVVAGDLDGGYLVTEAVAGAGEGRLYLIDKGTPAIATTATGNVNLAGGAGLQTAITAGSDTITLIKNPYKDLIIQPSPPTALLIGVAIAAIAANSFGWVQTRGPAVCLIDGTVVIGQEVMPSNGVDGAVEAWGLTDGTPNVAITPPCGHVIEVAPTGDYGTIMLKIE